MRVRDVVQISGELPQNQSTTNDYVKVLSRMHGSQIATMQARINQLEEENSKLKKRSEEAERCGMIDSLTGAYNRRFLDTIATQIITNEMRGKRPWCVFTLDIDFFKSVNDQYGHSCGDGVLKSVVAMLKHVSRDGDFVIRHGGDELHIIALNIEKEDIETLAERYRDSVAVMTTDCGGRSVAVTISMGVCFVPSDSSMELMHVIEYADGALYEAKRSGRNCFKMFSDRRKIYRDQRESRA